MKGRKLNTCNTRQRQETFRIMKKGLTVVFPLYINRLDEKMRDEKMRGEKMLGEKIMDEKMVGGINTKYPMDGLEMFFP